MHTLTAHYHNAPNLTVWVTFQHLCRNVSQDKTRDARNCFRRHDSSAKLFRWTLGCPTFEQNMCTLFTSYQGRGSMLLRCILEYGEGICTDAEYRVQPQMPFPATLKECVVQTQCPLLLETAHHPCHVSDCCQPTSAHANLCFVTRLCLYPLHAGHSWRHQRCSSLMRCVGHFCFCEET